MMVFVVCTPQDYTALLYVSDTLTDRVTLFTQLDLRLVYTLYSSESVRETGIFGEFLGKV